MSDCQCYTPINTPVGDLTFITAGEYWLNPTWMPNTPSWYGCGIPLGFCATPQDLANSVQAAFNGGWLDDDHDPNVKKKWYAVKNEE